MSKKALIIPYSIFLGGFVVLPLILLLRFAFTDKNGAVSFENAVYFFTSSKMIGTIVYSLIIGGLTTIICLLIAYPTAYILAKGSFKKNTAFIMVFVLPMWVNFTLRITALKEILTLIEGNIAEYPFINTIIGMVYDFLPFMILPLYNSLTRLDDRYIEAAKDLGAKPIHVLLKIILPLSLPGIISGVTMVLLPSMTNYVVLDMVYNSTFIVGSLIGSYFHAYEWNLGALVSVVLLIFIGLISIWLNRIDRSGLKVVS